MKRFFLLLLGLWCVVSLAGCTGSGFIGSIDARGDRYYLVYSDLTGTQFHRMLLQEGMVIQVIIENTAGHIDIYVTDSRGAVLYQGNDAGSGQFLLVTPRTDNYSFKVVGKKAKGSVLFQVR